MTITKTGSTSGRETLQIRGALYWRTDNDDNDNNDGNNDNDTDNENKSPSHESVRQQTYSVSAWSRPAARPVVIAVVKDASDVQACLQWAQQQQPQYTVCVRSGGHNWFESSLQQDTLLLDLSQLNGCQIDATTATATVEPACLGQALNEAAATHGLCFPNGHCPGVPVGSFLLGGGFGWFTDFYGLSVQSVIGVTVVTAAGEVVHATDEMHAANDWMWLCRGSGSAFPGVMIWFTVRLHPLPAIIKSRTLTTIQPWPSIYARGDCRGRFPQRWKPVWSWRRRHQAWWRPWVSLRFAL